MASHTTQVIKSSRVSLVIPLFNEEEGIALLAKSLAEIAPRLPQTTEIIFVNDGSSDETLQQIKKTNWPWSVSILEFSRNFGHQAALLAGMQAAKGDKVVTLDGDLQHPPALIPEMLELSETYDIVLTQRLDIRHKTGYLKSLTSELFYWVVNQLSETPVLVNGSDFRLLNRVALDHLLAMPEHRKFLRGMVNWIGFKSIVIPFEVGTRARGESKYSLQKMLQLAFHGVTSFSVLPLYFSGFFSVMLFMAAFFYAMYVLYVRFVIQAAVSGWASVLFVLLVLGGFITLFLGLLGFYLAAIYEEVKQRPMYIVKAKHQL